MSLEFAKTFSFMRKDTFIHNLDPRSKGLMLISFSILSIYFKNLIPMIILLILIIPLILISKTISQFLNGIKGIFFIIFFILVINTYVISLNFSLVIIIRLMVLVGVFGIYFQTTMPEDLTQSLISLKIPYPIAFALSLSFRFVPTMAKESQIISDAQRSRGHKLDEGGLINQVKNLFPLILPMLMNSIRRAYHIAESLETRGFGVNKKPNYYYPLKFEAKDWVFSLLTILILIFGIILYKNLSLLPNFFLWEIPL